MAQVIVRNLEPAIIERLKRRARRRGRTPAQELRAILIAAARPSLADLRAEAAAIRRRYDKVLQTDSVTLLRADRDR